MFNLHAVQAKFGDCLIIEYGTDPKYILIDGGPKDVYDESLRPALESIVTTGVLEVVMISHIDMDHIKGILDMLTELQRQKNAGEEAFIKIKELWLNSFSDTIDTDEDLTQRMTQLYAQAASQGVQMNSTGIAIQGVKEGDQVTRLCTILDITMNPSSINGFYCVDDNSEKIVFDNLTFTIVGPNKKNLKNLKEKWEEWLEKQEDAVARGNFNFLKMADRSVPNLSSIAFLVEGDGKTILFTGDSRGDHLEDGLYQAGLLNYEGRLHVDIFKVQHHGSDRNSDARFFEVVTADTYVISADGENDNPDIATLGWIAEAARKQGRRFKLVITNKTASTKKFEKDYDKDEYRYSVKYIGAGKQSVKV